MRLRGAVFDEAACFAGHAGEVVEGVVSALNLIKFFRCLVEWNLKLRHVRTCASCRSAACRHDACGGKNASIGVSCCFLVDVGIQPCGGRAPGLARLAGLNIATPHQGADRFGVQARVLCGVTDGEPSRCSIHGCCPFQMTKPPRLLLTTRGPFRVCEGLQACSARAKVRKGNRNAPLAGYSLDAGLPFNRKRRLTTPCASPGSRTRIPVWVPHFECGASADSASEAKYLYPRRSFPPHHSRMGVPALLLAKVVAI